MAMKFEKPELKLVRFEWKDVLTASGNTGDPTTTPSTTEDDETPAF